MATRIGTLREEFDRDRNFIAVKPFRFNGAVFGPGQPFDKNLVSTRRLRQLFDSRYLKMAPVLVYRSEHADRPPIVVQMFNMLRPEEIPIHPEDVAAAEEIAVDEEKPIVPRPVKRRVERVRLSSQ